MFFFLGSDYITEKQAQPLVEYHQQHSSTLKSGIAYMNYTSGNIKSISFFQGNVCLTVRLFCTFYKKNRLDFSTFVFNKSPKFLCTFPFRISLSYMGVLFKILIIMYKTNFLMSINRFCTHPHVGQSQHAKTHCSVKLNFSPSRSST